MTKVPHEARQVAESFGANAERYDRTRPTYPDALIERVLAASPGRAVLDVGCGTGIAARQFQAAGCTVLAVEPDQRMAEFARRGGLAVEVATFEEWDAAGREFDAVVAGTAWHWVDPVAGAVKARRLLRPGGVLAAFWHVFVPPPEVSSAFVAACEDVMPGSPFILPPTASPHDAYRAMATKTTDGILAAGGFTAPEQWTFDWERTYTRDEWLDQIPTQGVLNLLPPDKLAHILTTVGNAIDDEFRMPYTATAVTATRTG
ncbi:class I SAM-dependent methyltransferase [Actinokineospora cianjurensis]|uniref:class I SAM-dependent methyltransferase n=1 Tax=Actinokineospora cianjurensis TaxID=585224 RepID=UPI003CCC8073